MGDITLGQLATFVISLSAFISAVLVIIKVIKSTIEKMMKPMHESLDKAVTNIRTDMSKEINSLRTDLEDIQISSIKTDLVNFMNQAEKDELNIQQRMNAHELYDKYTSKGYNSYIHDQWNDLVKRGKI